jgi:hypothetical protein
LSKIIFGKFDLGQHRAGQQGFVPGLLPIAGALEAVFSRLYPQSGRPEKPHSGLGQHLDGKGTSFAGLELVPNISRG